MSSLLKETHFLGWKISNFLLLLTTQINCLQHFVYISIYIFDCLFFIYECWLKLMSSFHLYFNRWIIIKRNKYCGHYDMISRCCNLSYWMDDFKNQHKIYFIILTSNGTSILQENTRKWNGTIFSIVTLSKNNIISSIVTNPHLLMSLFTLGAGNICWELSLVNTVVETMCDQVHYSDVKCMISFVCIVFYNLLTPSRYYSLLTRNYQTCQCNRRTKSSSWANLVRC